MYAIEMKADAMLPRERLRDLGAEHLSNQELLSILLRTGTKTTPVLEVANQILKNLDSLADFQHLSLQELQQINGIGYVKSIEIKAMIELAKRISKAEYVQKERIMSSERLARKMMLELSTKNKSTWWLFIWIRKIELLNNERFLSVLFAVRLLNHVKFSIMHAKIWQHPLLLFIIIRQAPQSQARTTCNLPKK